MPTSDYTPTEGCVCLGCEHARHVATVTTYLPSDRAQKYARSLHYKGIPPVEIAAEGFDAGIAAAASDALATVTPRTISTSAELDVLPVGSIVLDRENDSWHKHQYDWKCATSNYVKPDRYLPCRLIFDGTFPATAEPAPVLLTDPDDPRIKPGARVRVVLEATVSADPWGELRPGWVADHINGTYKVTEGVYLIAEAPDADAELVTTLFRTPNGSDWHPDDLKNLVDLIRAAGYDVVKQAL